VAGRIVRDYLSGEGSQCLQQVVVAVVGAYDLVGERDGGYLDVFGVSWESEILGVPYCSQGSPSPWSCPFEQPDRVAQVLLLELVGVVNCFWGVDRRFAHS
jgi:hypothetical protein